MSINRNRAKFNKAHNNQEYKKLFLQWWYPPYWDDGLNWYPQYRSGYKTPNKRIYPWERRKFRTWKYNRKTQWKS